MNATTNSATPGYSRFIQAETKRAEKARATRKQAAAYRKLETRRADAIAKLSAELCAAAKIAAPLWDRTATPKAHVAHSAVAILSQLIGYLCNLGGDNSAYTVGEFRELYERYFQRGWVNGDSDVEVEAFLRTYEGR